MRPRAILTPGIDDPGVRWLRETLAKLTGDPVAPLASTVYDDALEQRVRAYQRSHQLTVDGIVGARTQIAMLAELGLAEHAVAGEGPLTCRSSSTRCANRSTSGNARRARPSQVPLATPQPQLPRWALVVIGVLVAAVLVLGGAWWQSTRVPRRADASRRRRPSSAASSCRRRRREAPAAASRAGATAALESRARRAATAPAAPSRRRRARAGGTPACALPPPRLEPPDDALALPSAAALAAEGVTLPTLRLELHAFSGEPRDRFVFINGRKYVEGDRLAEGPQLVAIEPTGAVLAHAGRRFMLVQE